LLSDDLARVADLHGAEAIFLRARLPLYQRQNGYFLFERLGVLHQLQTHIFKCGANAASGRPASQAHAKSRFVA
jgi:hypothetical protein